MFAEWVTEGAAFGIKAFFAVLVFIAFCGAVVGLLGLGAKIMGGEDESEKHNRPRPL